MAVSKRLRFEILRRDGHRCRYCGRGVDEGAKLTIDHVMPVALGGTDEDDNLVTACADCNAGKTSSAPDAEHVAKVADDSIRWAEAMKHAATVQAAQAAARDAVVDAFDGHWARWTYSDGSTVTRPADWRATVGRWADAGLDGDTLGRLVDDVLPRNISDYRMWRYFCGAVKNVLSERAGIARALLDEEAC